jgi:Arc/MetJ-type ribon-helix-helix transcriptional regulator
MSTTISFVAEKKFSNAIDEIISKTGLYQSKSEFVRDAVREKIIKLKGLEKQLVKVEKVREKIQKKIKSARYLSDNERNELAKEHLKTLPE